MHQRIDKRALHNNWNTFRVESFPNSVRVNTIPFWACAPAVCGETLQKSLAQLPSANISPRALTQGLYIGIDLKVHKEVVCLFEREIREIAEVAMFPHGVCQPDG